MLKCIATPEVEFSARTAPAMRTHFSSRLIMSAAGPSCSRKVECAAILRSRCAVRWACALTALMASGWLAHQAQASCGDYVVIGRSAKSHDAPAQRKTSAKTQHESPRPCHGPNCQSVPRPLGIPPMPVNSVERTHELCLLSDLAAATSSPEPVRLRLHLANAPPLQGSYPPLWRPPEAA